MSAVAGRRTYTEDELQAALRDIQSGKLGTRRAAVIYGIPRSTLRNKVYKLALERERESHLNSSTPLKLEEDEALDDDKELSGAEEEKEVEKALQVGIIAFFYLMFNVNTKVIFSRRHCYQWPTSSDSPVWNTHLKPSNSSFKRRRRGRRLDLRLWTKARWYSTSRYEM